MVEQPRPEIKAELVDIGLWDVHPRNLFRVSWKNDPETGLFHGVNFMEIPRELTGVKARIFGLTGKFFYGYGIFAWNIESYDRIISD